MKRWNGWGNIATLYPLPDSSLDFLQARLGPLTAFQDSSLDSVLAAVPESKLPFHPLIDTKPETRLRHARGQSLPDWVALNHCRVETFPDGIAFPQRVDDVPELLKFAREHGARVIPYGGGTSVVGHINPLQDDHPILTLSMEKLDQMKELDEVSNLADFEAGVTGPQLEAQLQKNGYTLGHYPQSFEYSTLGGWIASRSSGQQSYHYGRIEDQLAGGQIETPQGRLDLPVFPASAAGPDLREMVLGSEGRMGIITRAKIRIKPLPETESFYGVFFPSWEQGLAAVRSITQNNIPVSMLRLSNPIETETTLVLSGKSWIDLADRGLRLVGHGNERCLFIFGVTGSPTQTKLSRRAVVKICRSYKGLFVGSIVGKTWEKSRFHSPYLRNTLWEKGAAIDTLETALPWSQVKAASQAIPEAIVGAARQSGERVLVMTHLSHIYPDGASIYTTYLFRRTLDPDELLERWSAMKGAASREIQKYGGTISHQHGVGTDHKPYLPAEKGILGMEAIRTFIKTFDPEGMLNPGKLFD